MIYNFSWFSSLFCCPKKTTRQTHLNDTTIIFSRLVISRIRWITDIFCQKLPNIIFLVLIPSESGERVSFIVALELSMIFIQQAVDSYVVPAGQDRNFPFIRTVIIGKRFISAWLPEFGPDMTHMSKTFSKPCDLADEFHFDDNFSTIWLYWGWLSFMLRKNSEMQSTPISGGFG